MRWGLYQHLLSRMATPPLRIGIGWGVAVAVFRPHTYPPPAGRGPSAFLPDTRGRWHDAPPMGEQQWPGTSGAGTARHRWHPNALQSPGVELPHPLVL